MRDLAFVWLTGNLHPDHNTLWRFFRDNKEALRKLFKLIVKFAVKADLVGFALHAIDGTKLAAASSMETAQHRKVLEERLKKLDSIAYADPERSTRELEPLLDRLSKLARCTTSTRRH